MTLEQVAAVIFACASSVLSVVAALSARPQESELPAWAAGLLFLGFAWGVFVTAVLFRVFMVGKA